MKRRYVKCILCDKMTRDDDSICDVCRSDLAAGRKLRGLDAADEASKREPDARRLYDVGHWRVGTEYGEPGNGYDAGRNLFKELCDGLGIVNINSDVSLKWEWGAKAEKIIFAPGRETDCLSYVARPENMARLVRIHKLICDILADRHADIYHDANGWLARLASDSLTIADVDAMARSREPGAKIPHYTA